MGALSGRLRDSASPVVQKEREPWAVHALPGEWRSWTVPDSDQLNVVYSIAVGSSRRDGGDSTSLYLGLSNEFEPGVHGRLVRFNCADESFSLLGDMGTVLPEARQALRPPHSKFHLGIVVDSDGLVYAATHMTAPPAGEHVHRAFEIYNDGRRWFSGSHLLRYDPRTDRLVDLGIVSPKEGVRILAINPELHELYALTYPRDHFLVVTTEGQVRDLGRVGQDNAFGLCWCKDGCTYTTDDDGFFLRYRPRARGGDGTLEHLAIRIPDAPWRDGTGNLVRRMITGPDGFTLYGAGTKGMRIFAWRPDNAEVRDYGPVVGTDRPSEYSYLPSVKALAFGSDGWLYIATVPYSGYARSDSGCELWRLNPQSGLTQSLGLIGGADGSRFTNCQQAAASPDGSIYFGMQTAAPSPATLVAWRPKSREGMIG